jgi:hypothetical protein
MRMITGSCVTVTVQLAAGVAAMASLSGEASMSSANNVFIPNLLWLPGLRIQSLCSAAIAWEHF